MQSWQKWRSEVEGMFQAALKACDPEALVKNFLMSYDFTRFKNVFVVGWGKASGGMARVLEEELVTNIEKALVLSIKDREGSIPVRAVPHPLPNERTIELTKEVEGIVQAVGPNDLLICLVSGGGSAMLCDPVIPLDALKQTVINLMMVGADIRELNAFRRSVSNVKGGRLGEMCRGHILNLMISDVIGGGLWDIASGPTVEDKSKLSGIEIAEKYGLPEKVLRLIDDDRPSVENESYILAENATAVKAAFEHGKSLGLDVFARKEPYTGKVKDIGRLLFEEARSREFYVAGGETTVTLMGPGIGGRNQHLCLSLHDEPCDCFSAGTDGIDGISDAAGAFLDEGSRSPDWKKYYERYDSASFFAKSNSQFKTGPTGTNVCDITILRKD
jgi:glycerate-2-kinase